MKHQYTKLEDFEPWQLEAYLDGEPMPDVAAFLDHNPTVRARLEQENAQSRQLNKLLYRFDCPMPEALQAYHWDELQGEAYRAMASHLKQCPQCNAEFAALQHFVDEPQTSTQSAVTTTPNQPGLVTQLQEWFHQVRVIVAILVTPSGPQLASVALRSATAASTAPTMLLFEAEEADVSLLIHKQLDDTYRVDGQLFVPPLAGGAAYTFTSAQPGMQPVGGEVNSTGSFTINGLSSGLYQLVIKLPEQAIVVPNITLT